jgi:hypothetical protein
VLHFIFLLKPCHCQRFPKLCGEATSFIYAISFQSVNGKACGSKAASLIIYFFWLMNVEQTL